MVSSPFDTGEAGVLNEARRRFLTLLIEDFIQREHLSAALDVGCGAPGVFTRFLHETGLQPVGMEGRPENVPEARLRNPGIGFLVGDIEDKSIAEQRTLDLVLCFGLLYHLENPFLAVRNLQHITRKYLLMETQRLCPWTQCYPLPGVPFLKPESSHTWPLCQTSWPS